MSPVHVIVGEDARAEQMWSSAFTGAVDLYRFDRNVDAFERLTAAQAPIDLVVLTPAQRGPFNLTPDQFVARVLEGPLGASSVLANLHVIVVGESLTRSHPRAMAVSTLDAAIRLVKFGEVEQAPRPVVAQPEQSVQPTSGGERDYGPLGDVAGEFSGSIISRIWNAIDGGDDDDDGDGGDVLGGGPSMRRERPEPPVVVEPEPEAMPRQVAGPAPLFSRAAPAGFVATGGGAPAPAVVPVASEPAAAPGPAQVDAVMQVGAPNETIAVATGAVLQPARGYQLEGGGAYRGPAIRNGVIHAAAHDVGGQPVPPALASQVQSMVYGGMQVGNPHDPVMIWSSAMREAQEAAPQPGAQPQVPAVPQSMAQQHLPVQPQQVRVVPMEPPAGAYPGAVPGGAVLQAQSPAAAADPFLARAEAQGGSVAFG